MAELFGPDIHQKVFAIGVFAIEALDGVLHRRGQLAVGSPKLLKKHVAECGIGFVDPNSVHKLFDVVIHGDLRGNDAECAR